MLIGELADLFGITTKTLRHYEKIGLLEPERTDSGYREYGPADVLRVQRIRQLQALGLDLKRVGHILEHSHDEDMWLTVLEGLLAETEDEIATLTLRARTIERLIGEEVFPDALDDHLPQKRVETYLEEHLKPAENALWLTERQIFNQLRSQPSFWVQN